LRQAGNVKKGAPRRAILALVVFLFFFQSLASGVEGLVFLHVSKKEQRKRFLKRLEEPEKNWKFSPSDVAERTRWDDYMRVYEEMIQNTSSERAPWHIVPADHKWVTRLVVAGAVIETLEELNLAYPKVDAEKRKALDTARKALEKEGENNKG